MDNLMMTFAIVCPLIFLASFIDAVAGGGGLVSLPAFLLAGMPPHMALGTNKVVMPTGTLIATVNYLRGGKMQMKVAVYSAIGALIGGGLGSRLILFVPEEAFKIIILVALPLVAIFIATQKNFGSDDSVMKELPHVRIAVYSLLIGLFIGFYDGMVGPGTGTFLILAYTKVFNLDLVTSSGCAKLANLTSNIASAIVLSLAGQVMWIVVAPAVVCAMVGGRIGSSYAMKGGSKNVRKVIYVVLVLLIIKFLTELL